jgi:hypothetical protein
MSYTLEMNTPVKTPIRYEFPVYPLCNVGTGTNEGALEPLMTALERDNFLHSSLLDSERVAAGFSSPHRHIWQLLDGVARGCYTEEATKVAIHLTTQLMQLVDLSFNEAFDDSLSSSLLYTKGCIISSEMETIDIKKTAPLGWFVLEESQISFKSNSTKQDKPQTHWSTLSEEWSWGNTVTFAINNYYKLDKNLTKEYLQDPAAISFVGLERLFPTNTNSDPSDALNTVKFVAFGAAGKITNWHFEQDLGWANKLMHATTNIAIEFQGVRHQAPVSLTNCSFYNFSFISSPKSSPKIHQPTLSVATLGGHNSKIFNTCAFRSIDLIDRDLNNSSAFYNCVFLEGSVIDIRCPNPRGVYLTNCFGTNDVPSGWKIADSDVYRGYRGHLSIMTSPGQFIDIAGIGENDITEVARANSNYHRLLAFSVAVDCDGVVPVKAEPVKISFADLPEYAPLDLTVNGPVQVFASDITLDGIYVKNNNKGQSPFQFTGVDVDEVDLGATLMGNLGKDILLSYTKQVDAIGDKPDGFDYSKSKRLGAWAFAQTVGKLNAGMTEKNEQGVKLAIQKLMEVNRPELKDKSKTTPGTKRM